MIDQTYSFLFLVKALCVVSKLNQKGIVTDGLSLGFRSNDV